MKRVREGYKITELGEIPEEWRLETMKNIIVSTQLGTNTLGKEGVINGIPMLKMGNLTIGGFNFDKVEYIESEELEDNKEYILNNGDFLFNTRNTLELVGKSATWNNQLPVAIFNSNIMRIKYKSNIDDFYMSYYFEDSAGWKHLKAIATGTTSVAAVYTKDLMKVKVKLPTLKEQQKISLVLSSVDEQIEITDNLIEKTKYLKKGLMQKLFTKGIGHSRFKDTEIGKIPEEWEVRRLGDIAEYINGKAFKPSDWSEEGLPIIRIQNLNGSNEFNYCNKQVEEKYYIENNELLFSWSGSRGTSFGPFIWKGDKAVLNQHIFKVELNEELNKSYCYFALKRITQDIEENAHGSAGLVHITKGELEKFKIPIPKELEQKKIASILSMADEQIEQNKSKKEKLQELKKGLMQKLLTGDIRVKA